MVIPWTGSHSAKSAKRGAWRSPGGGGSSLRRRHARGVRRGVGEGPPRRAAPTSIGAARGLDRMIPAPTADHRRVHYDHLWSSSIGVHHFVPGSVQKTRVRWPISFGGRTCDLNPGSPAEAQPDTISRRSPDQPRTVSVDDYLQAWLYREPRSEQSHPGPPPSAAPGGRPQPRPPTSFSDSPYRQSLAYRHRVGAASGEVAPGGQPTGEYGWPPSSSARRAPPTPLCASQPRAPRKNDLMAGRSPCRRRTLGGAD